MIEKFALRDYHLSWSQGADCWADFDRRVADWLLWFPRSRLSVANRLLEVVLTADETTTDRSRRFVIDWSPKNGYTSRKLVADPTANSCRKVADCSPAACNSYLRAYGDWSAIISLNEKLRICLQWSRGRKSVMNRSRRGGLGGADFLPWKITSGDRFLQKYRERIPLEKKLNPGGSSIVMNYADD